MKKVFPYPFKNFYETALPRVFKASKRADALRRSAPFGVRTDKPFLKARFQRRLSAHACRFAGGKPADPFAAAKVRREAQGKKFCGGCPSGTDTDPPETRSFRFFSDCRPCPVPTGLRPPHRKSLGNLRVSGRRVLARRDGASGKAKAADNIRYSQGF